MVKAYNPRKIEQEFLKNQWVEGKNPRIPFDSQYDVGRDIKNIGKKSLIPGLVLIGCFGLAAILDRPDEDISRMQKGIIVQEAYQDSINYEGK